MKDLVADIDFMRDANTNTNRADDRTEARAAADSFDFYTSREILGAGDSATEARGAHMATAAAAAGSLQGLIAHGNFAVVSGGTAAATFDIAELGGQAALLTGYSSGHGGLGVTSDFNIDIVFKGNDWTPGLQDAFVKAAEYLSSIITGDLADAFRGRIDDLRISARLTDIDGSGGTLGAAGPLFFRDANGLPIFGTMKFDIADAADFDAMGLFDDIVLHEMMHVLGIGTIWESLGLTTGTVFGDDMRFTGENATQAYNTELADIAADDPDSLLGVPVETDGGPGTAGGHWDDDTFDDELMTGYISDPNYVSSMTVASLEDIGYETIYDSGNPSAPMPQPDDLIA